MKMARPTLRVAQFTRQGNKRGLGKQNSRMWRVTARTEGSEGKEGIRYKLCIVGCTNYHWVYRSAQICLNG